MMVNELKILTGNANPELAQEVCSILGVPLSAVRISRFPDETIFVQIGENVREKDVYVIQPGCPPTSDNLMELFLMVDALKSASARRITAVVPYFPYSRADKKDHPRISIAARLMADLIQASGADRVLTMNLHAWQIHGFFSIPVDHLLAAPILCDHVRKRDLSDTVVVATDAGGSKVAGDYASRLDLPLAIADKRRVAHGEDPRIVNIVGEVEGRNCLVFDDEISTAGSVCQLAQALKEHGAHDIRVAVTHGLLCGPAVERLQNAPISEVIVTNTVRIPAQKRIPKLTVLSVAPLIAAAIRNIHTGESVSALFT
jgi:ribose-phosphate pyrophosphokinase